MDMITKFFERLRELFTEIVYGWKTFREKNRFVDWFVGWFDWLAILSGVFALLLIFLGPIEKEQSWIDNWVFVNGAICVLYLLYSTWLMLFNRVKFDWHLINGNFLRKVICLVVLVPFMLTSILFLCEPEICQDLSRCQNVEQTNDSSLLWSVYYNFIDPGTQLSDLSRSPRGRSCPRRSFRRCSCQIPRPADRRRVWHPAGSDP